MSFSEVQRSKGQNAVASIAYNARDKLNGLVVDPVTGDSVVKTWDYRKLTGLSYSAILAPEHAPDWVYDRQELWSRCEEFENRKNSQTARKMMIALPKELTEEQNILLVQEFVRNYLVEHGMVVDINIHYDNPNNPHVHLQMTTRELVKIEGADSDNGVNSDVIDFSNHKNRHWGSKLFWRYLMEGVAVTTNKHLELHGFTARISHLSHKERGIDLVPTIHEGPARHIPDSLLRKKNEEIIKANAKAIMANPELVLDRLSVNKPVFTKEEIAEALMETMHHGMDMKNIETSAAIEMLNKNTNKQFLELYAKVMASEQLALITESDLKGRVLYTKTKRLELEKRYIDTVEELNATSNHKLNLHVSDLSTLSFAEKLAGKVQAITNISKADKGQQAELSDEQKTAVLNILNGADISILEGIPGSGKTTAMREIVRQYRCAGYEVIGVAPSSSAALSLEQATGIQSKNATLWRKEWLEEVGEKFDLVLKTDYYKEKAYRDTGDDRYNKINPLPQKQVMIIDEASMGELANMDYLLTKAKRSGSKVILVGDNNQFAAVGAAGALKKVIDICGSEKLYESRRQINPEHQKATKLLGHFRIREALEIYQKDNVLKIDESREASTERLVNDYIESYLNKSTKSASDNLAVRRNIVVCTYTNDAAQMFNGLIRDKLKQSGVIKGKGSIVNIGGKQLELCKGEQIVFTRNLNHLGSRGIYNGELGTVLSVTLYNSGTSANSKTTDKNVTYKNTADTHNHAVIKIAVTKADGSIEKITIDTESTLKSGISNNQRNRQILDYGYAVTAHKLQGATVDQSLVFYEKQVGYEAFNVMMTRHRETTALYADRQSLHDNIYARLDLNIAEARKVYRITGAETKGGKVSRDDIDLIGLNIGVSRRVNNSFAGDYADMGLKETDHTIKEYMETSKQSVDLIRQISKWQIQQERITGSKPPMHKHELWPGFYEVKQQRNNIARTIVTDYNNYQERITQLGINYATLEKRAYELKTYKVEERSSILYKESANYINLVAAIKTSTDVKTNHGSTNSGKSNQTEQIKLHYHALRTEMIDNEAKLEQTTKQLQSLKTEHDSINSQIADHKQYRTKLLPEYLKRIYREPSSDIMKSWQSLSRQHGKLMAAEMVNRKPELLGKLHGVGFGKWLGISNKRIDAIINMENLGKHLKQYETIKENQHELKHQLNNHQYLQLKPTLEQEIKYLKALLPAKIDQEFINEVGKVLHKYSHHPNHNRIHAQSYIHKQSDNHNPSDNDNQKYNQNHDQTNINSNSNANLLSKADLQHLNNQLHKVDHFFNKQHEEIVNTINQEIRHLKQYRFVERDGIKFYTAKSYLEHLTQDKLLAPYLRNTNMHEQLDRINKAQEREMQMEKRMSRSMDEGFSM